MFLELDFQDMGIDLADPAIRRGRSWRWFSTRVMGLIYTKESRLQKILNPQDQPKK